jgi:hypothetical protein
MVSIIVDATPAPIAPIDPAPMVAAPEIAAIKPATSVAKAAALRVS